MKYKNRDYEKLLQEEFGVSVCGMKKSEVRKLYESLAEQRLLGTFEDLIDVERKYWEQVNNEVHDALWEERHISF